MPLAMPLALLYLSGRADQGGQICVDPAPGTPPSDDFGCFDLGPPAWKLVLYAAGAIAAVIVAIRLWRSAGRPD